MIYRVLYNGTSIYDEDSSLMLLEPNVETELNSAGSFKFKMNTMHQYYDLPDILKDDVEVYEDNELIFFGRPVSINTDVWLQKEIYCEGPLSFFNDSIQRPHEYQAVSIRTFFTDVVNNHNAQVPANRRFTVGNITVQDKVVYRKLDYQKTFDVIRDMCIDTDGGYIFFRKVNGVNYIDWLNGMPYTADQPVEYGLNLVNLTQILDGSDIVTSILPLGDEVNGEKLTIKSVNDGKDYLDAQAAGTYGRMIEVIDFQGITDATTLKTRANEWLTNKQFDRLTFEVEAAELHYIDGTYGPFKVGQTVHVVSTPHLVDKNFPLSKMSISLNSGVKTITIGTEPRKELTEITSGSTYSGSTSSGGGSGGGTEYVSEILFDNPDLSPVSGTNPVFQSYTLSKSIDQYDAVMVCAWTYNTGNRDGYATLLVLKNDFYKRASSSETVYYAFSIDGSHPTARRMLYFGFEDNVTIKTASFRTVTDDTPVLEKVYGIKFGSGNSSVRYSLDEQVIGTWIGGETLYQKTLRISNIEVPANSNTRYNLSDYISNVDSVIGSESFIIVSGSCVALPFINYLNNVYYQVSVSIEGDYIYVSRSPGSITIDDLYITIKYTKTNS